MRAQVYNNVDFVVNSDTTQLATSDKRQATFCYTSLTFFHNTHAYIVNSGQT